ncbi:flagellar protein FlaG [Thalassotalea sp. M1531]|uniref:Flagellar protein FlaG n=1 Tax=Thalassotalea algicola TaxID=2716224 RepID=A0A7Y0LEQ1_9GAMM|nr:flagellar protein FlaG [Thalassotalea algicola]NMP32888.1 flagellar protein FlaG [Thalassotalea algicola]
MAIDQIRDNGLLAKTNVEPLSSTVGANIAKEQKETELNKSVESVEVVSSLKKQMEEQTAEQINEQQDKESEKSVSEVIEFLNKEMPMVKTSLVFEFDELNEPPIVKVIDQSNGETIREIPPKYLKEVTTSLQDVATNLSNSGVLFDKKA